MKIFTKEVKIALTAILAIALLYYIISFMKGVNIFKSSNTYYVQFENIQGLPVSSSVYANGFPVGIVRDIVYDYDRTDKVVVIVDLDKAMQVPKGTRAELETSLMGGVTMSLLLGPNPTDLVSKGDTIIGQVHQGALAQAEKIVPDLIAMAPKLDSIMTNLNQLTGDPALRQTLANAAALTSNLKSSSDKLNAMMNNDLPQIMTHLHQVSKNFDQVSGDISNAQLGTTLAELGNTLNEVKQFSANLNSISTNLDQKLNGKDNSLGLLLNDRKLYDNLNHTIESADTLVTDLKLHPKRYVHFSVFGGKNK